MRTMKGRSHYSKIMFWTLDKSLNQSLKSKKSLNYDDSCGKTNLFQTHFLVFEIQQLFVFKPVEIENSYIHQKKALDNG